MRTVPLAGVAGPAAFLAAWAILGSRQDGYSPTTDPISRLAAVDSPSRVGMTAGLLAFAVGVGAYAGARRAALGPRGSTVALATTALASAGVAVTPLDSSLGGMGHAACVAVAYSSLVAVPLLQARELGAEDGRRRALVPLGFAVATGAALAASLVATRTGLWQRIGLTTGHAWIGAGAVHLARRARR